MFGKVIYYDKSKVEDYTAIITGKPVTEVKSAQKSSRKEAGLSFSPLNVGAGGEATYELAHKESALYSISEFEKLLKDRDDFFDFSVTGNTCLDAIHAKQIIKFNGFIHIPEAFDMIQLITQFKPMIMSQATVGMKEDEADMLQTFFDVENPKIPIMSNIDDKEICARLETEYLKTAYEGLEEYEDQEVTILARTLSSSTVDKTKPFFEPMKHFIQISRTLRRSMGTDMPEGLEPLYSDDNYRLLEIIAMYA